MSDLTQEEQDWLERNKDVLGNTSLSTEPAPATEEIDPAEDPEMDPELKAFLERNPSIDLSKTSLDPNNRLSPIPGTGQIAADVTPEVTSVREQQDGLTYEGLYGEYPDNPLTSRVISSIDPEDTESSAAVAEYERDLAEWTKNANEIYESTGFIRNGQRQYVKTVPTTGEDGETVWEQKYFLIPSPKGSDSYAAVRSLEQAARDIYQSVGGLIQTGSFLEESELERNVADYDQQGGEALLTTMLGVAVPAVGVAGKARKYAGKLVKGGKLGAKGTIAVDAATTALVESIMAQEGSEGLIIKPSILEPAFGSGAKDVSIFLDGMFLNGTLDGVISVLSKGGRFAADKVSATRKLANRETLRKAVTDETMASALEYIDPKIMGGNAAEAKRRIYLLAEKLEEGSVIDLVLGTTRKTVTADTPTTVLRMSEAYVREADQNLLSSMTEEQFENHVLDEAARMSTAMINLMRSRMSEPMVQNAANRTQNEIGSFVQDAARQNLPDGFDTVDAAAQNAAENVVRGVDEEVAGLTARADDVTRQTDELLSAQRTVVEDNPVVVDMIGDTNVFSSDLSTYRNAVQDIFSEDVYRVYKDTFEEVDAAYRNLPDAEIDAELLKDRLSMVVREANVMDGSGRRAAAVLRDVLEPFTARAKEAAGDDTFVPFGLDLDKAVNSKESLDEVLDRITKDVRFQDLYQIKANMSSVIDRYRNEPAVQQRLISFRNHITNAETGQIASIARTQPEVANQYLQADAMFKEAKAKFSNSDELRALEQKLAERRRFDTERGSIPGPFGRGEPDVTLGGDRLSQQVVGDTTGVLDTQIKYILDGVRSADDLDGAFRDLFVAQAAQDLRQRLLVAGEAGQTEEIIAAAFLPYQQRLQDVGAQGVLDDVATAFAQVRDARQNLGDMALFGEESLKRIDDEIKQAQAGIVGKLISSTPGRPRGLDAQGPSFLVTRSDAGQQLERIITGPDSVNAIRELQSRIATLPTSQQAQAQQALQAISLDAVGKKIFGATDVSVRDKTIALGKVNALTSDEASNLLKSVDVLFGATDDQLLMKEMLLETLDTLQLATKPQRVKVAQSGSDTAINTQRNSDIRDAASTGILVFAGYMNPTAALLRRMSSVPIQQAEELQKQVSADVLNVIVTDPNVFAQFARAYADGQPDSVLRQIVNSSTALSKRTLAEEQRIQEPEDPSPLDRDMLQMLGILE